MMIHCPLCQTEISVLKTKANKSYANCHNCHMRIFANSELAEQMLKDMAIDESPPKTKNEPDKSPDSDSVVRELKRLRERVSKLESQSPKSKEGLKIRVVQPRA